MDWMGTRRPVGNSSSKSGSGWLSDANQLPDHSALPSPTLHNHARARSRLFFVSAYCMLGPQLSSSSLKGDIIFYIVLLLPFAARDSR